MDDDREERMRRNRELMPETAKVVDAFRAAFGPGVVLTYAKEGDLELGKRGAPGVPVTDYLPPPPIDEWSS
jgi:hypothetical protein